MNFASALKLGHYAKVPQKAMFKVQLFGAVLGTLVALAVNDWTIENVKDLCVKGQTAKLICPAVSHPTRSCW